MGAYTLLLFGVEGLLSYDFFDDGTANLCAPLRVLCLTKESAVKRRDVMFCCCFFTKLSQGSSGLGALTISEA